MTIVPPTESSGLPAGAKLGPYFIQVELGRGGFGVTYKAQDTKLDRPVVIKEYQPQDFAARRGDWTVGPRSASQAESFQMGLNSFLEEAQTLAKFHHPNIVPVLNFFKTPTGTAYMVMPFIEGETLSARLDSSPGGRMSASEVLDWLNPLLDGLQTIHAAGFLHRDLKPENIYLLKNGQPILIDFGSARNALISRSRNLSVLLTPGYAPLEQYSTVAATQGPWTDLYSLGAVIYRCLTGAVPPDSTERQDAALNGEPDPLPAKDLSGLAGPALTAAVEGCLRLARKERIQGVAELRQLLQASRSRSHELRNDKKNELAIRADNKIYDNEPRAGMAIKWSEYLNKSQAIDRQAGIFPSGQKNSQKAAGLEKIPVHDQPAVPQPAKFGVCLILLGIQLVFVSSIILLVLPILLFELFEMNLSFYRCVFGLFFLAWLYTTAIFFKKKSGFPKICIIMHITFVIITGINKGLGLIYWLIIFIAAMIWISYLSYSKHVKRVFIK